MADEQVAESGSEKIFWSQERERPGCGMSPLH